MKLEKYQNQQNTLVRPCSPNQIQYERPTFVFPVKSLKMNLFRLVSGEFPKVWSTWDPNQRKYQRQDDETWCKQKESGWKNSGTSFWHEQVLNQSTN